MLKPLKSAIYKKFDRQQDFAKIVGSSEVRVSKAITGRAELSDDEKKMWAKKLDNDPQELFAD